MLKDKPNFKGKTAESVIFEILHYMQQPVNGIWAANKVIIEALKSNEKASKEQLHYFSNASLEMSEKLLLVIDEIREWRNEQHKINE